ncbi:MAG: hypothetical protein IT462_17595 [Planctomycetes bacterium]|nr:hypothetical protein [Planctomycetota bacterium]
MPTKKQARPAAKPPRKVSRSRPIKAQAAMAARSTPSRVPSRGDEEE